VLSDHTSYWAVPNDFVPEIARQILTWSGITDIPAIPRVWRYWRVAIRRVVGIILSIASIWLYILAGAELRESLLAPALNWLIADSADDSIHKLLVSSILEKITYGLGLTIHLGIVWLYGSKILDPSWNALECTLQQFRKIKLTEPNIHLSWKERIFSLWPLPCLRGFTCILLTTLPLWALYKAILAQKYNAMLETFTIYAEWTLGLIGYLILFCFFCALTLLIIVIVLKCLKSLGVKLPKRLADLASISFSDK
jgi:hypothetical protein